MQRVDLDIPSTVAILRRAARLTARSLSKRQWGAMAIAVVALLVGGWLANVPAILFGRIIDVLGQNRVQGLRDVSGPLFLIILSVIGRQVVIVARKICVEWVASALQKEHFVAVMRVLVLTDILAFGKQRVGSLQKRVDRSVDGIVTLVKIVLLDLGPVMASAIWALGFGFAEHFGAGLIMLGVAMLGALFAIWQIQSQKGIRIGLFRAKEEIAGKTVELLGSLDYIQASNAASHELRRSEELAEELRTREFRHHRYMILFAGAKQLTEGFGYVAIITFGAWLVVRGVASEGDVLKLALLFVAVATPLGELHRIVDEGFEATLRVADLEELYSLPAGPAARWGKARPDVENPLVASCRNVTIDLGPSGAHGSGNLLRNVSLELRRGEIVGCAGDSGSGKSTLARVILGIIRPSSGEVRLFGELVSELDRGQASRHVGYVSQTPFLVAGTLRTNLLYGSDVGGDDDRLLLALQKAHLSHLAKTVGGLELAVAEGGRNLSGGERQRLAIARVFVQRPRLVVLDEATSALDANTDDAVMSEVLGLRAEAALLVIAHRLATLRPADTILVFRGGEICESGTFAELSSRGGVFGQMAQRQGLAAASCREGYKCNS